MKKIGFITFIFIALCSLSANAQNRTQTTLEKGWKFTRDENPRFADEMFDDSKWQSVRVPHDWAIYGPFDWRNDLQNTAITQDGQKQAMEHAGRTGGLPFVGKVFYRTRFHLPDFSDNKRITLLFDGAMAHPEIYVNGKKAGEWG